MTNIVIPFTRVEGHLKVELTVDDITNVVSSGRCVGSLFRGFETIVLNRDPRDCAPILSAICGVCHSDHHIDSVRAVENSVGMTKYTDNYAREQTSLPMNAVLARNVVSGANWAYSHAVHLLVLAGPDYHLYGLLTALQESVVVNSYADLLHWVIIPAQQYMNQIITLWGGKSPHQRGSIPGGNPVKPTTEVIEQTRTRINQFRDTLDIVAPIVWNYLTANALELSSLGAGTGNFISMGSFPDPTTSAGTGNMPLRIPRGFIQFPNTTPESFNPANITEDVSTSWYDQPDGVPVIGEQTPVPDMSKSGAYTWGKTPRYKGLTTESGALRARIHIRYISSARQGHQ